MFRGERRERCGGGAGRAAIGGQNRSVGIQGVGLLGVLLLALELLIGLLPILPVMLALVTDHLAARVQDEVAVLAHAVDVVADGGELACLEGTLLRLQDLLETISRQLRVLQVVCLVLVWEEREIGLIEIQLELTGLTYPCRPCS